MPGLPMWIQPWCNIELESITNWRNTHHIRGKVFPLILALVITLQGCSLPRPAEIKPTDQQTGSPMPSVTATLFPTQTVSVPTQTPLSTQTPVLTNTPEIQLVLEIQPDNSEISIEIPKYTLIQSRPVLSGTVESVKDFNLQMDNLFQEQVDIFIQQAQENETWRAQTVPEFSSELDIRYDLAYLSGEVISLSIPVMSYIAGMAHPDNFNRVINYDLVHSRVLGLGDVFWSEEQILPVLAGYCREELKSKDELMFEEGVLPESVNYQNWVITEQGFKVIFNPYHVAPYALGTITVTIPWEVLSAEINPDGPLVSFMSQ